MSVLAFLQSGGAGRSDSTEGLSQRLSPRCPTQSLYRTAQSGEWHTQLYPSTARTLLGAFRSLQSAHWTPPRFDYRSLCYAFGGFRCCNVALQDQGNVLWKTFIRANRMVGCISDLAPNLWWSIFRVPNSCVRVHRIGPILMPYCSTGFLFSILGSLCNNKPYHWARHDKREHCVFFRVKSNRAPLIVSLYFLRILASIVCQACFFRANSLLLCLSRNH